MCVKTANEAAGADIGSAIHMAKYGVLRKKKKFQHRDNIGRIIPITDGRTQPIGAHAVFILMHISCSVHVSYFFYAFHIRSRPASSFFVAAKVFFRLFFA
jgi:hypothetical protein